MRSEEAANELDRVQTRAFVTDEGTSAIVCPNCGMTKQIPVAEYRGNKHSIKIRCRCQQTFTIDLEFRQSHLQHLKHTLFYKEFHLPFHFQ